MINLLTATNRDASPVLAFETDGCKMLHNQQNNHPSSACQFFLIFFFFNGYDNKRSVLMQAKANSQT